MKIDPEFQSFIPPLTAVEFAALRASIQRDGFHDPVIVWDETGILIDGHNRWAIAEELDAIRSVPQIRMSFPDRDAVKAWMFEHQIARRNLSPDQLIALAAARGIETKTGTERQRSMAADLAAAAPDILAAVISGRRPLGIAWGAWARKAGKAPARAPRSAVPAPRTAEVITAEARAKAAASAAKADAKTLEKRILELETAVEFMHAGPSQPPRIDTPSARPKSGKRIGDPVFLISDLHFGETVTQAESLATNLYDLDVAAGRMRKCWDNMLWLRGDMARTVSCDNTVIVLNGDIVSGDIHDELRETNDGGLRTQCDAAYAALYPGLVEFAAATPGYVHVICIGGNHGRLTHKQHIKNGTQHSAEHIGVYDPLRRVLGAGPKGNIVWHIPESERHLFDIHGRRMSTQHGTMIKSAGGIGGTLVPMTRWVTKDKSADLYLFGHFHEADAYGKIIKNGALIGESAYTKWLGIEPGRPPEQVAFVIDADAGVRRFERVSVWCELDRENGIHK